MRPLRRLSRGLRDAGPCVRQYYTIHKTETPGVVRKHTDEEFFMEFTSEEEEDLDEAVEAE